MRESGILMHISSLPNKYGIGKLGSETYAFADFLKKSGQTYWQILPISPTSYGDSPYQSFSIYAGNPYFIDFEQLADKGLLKKAEYINVNWGESKTQVDYGQLYKVIFKVLKKAFKRFDTENAEFVKYVNENSGWLETYALFMSLKDAHKGKAWYEWEKPLKMYEPKAISDAFKKYAEDIKFWEFLQFEYSTQWKKLKDYVNFSGLKIIGDIPIYVAYDSADVWSNPQYFLLDENKQPIDVAGCPPDVFSALGQLWGNPLYRWDVMEKENFDWWISRINSASETYDVVRIDHFRGFESYYTIPFGNDNAIIGEWRKGPDIALFKEVKKRLGKLNIIAEDLGFLTPQVTKMLKASGFPGMKVLEFGYDPEGKSGYLPHNFKNTNAICYTGTHDNQTIVGWVNSLSRKEAKFWRDYLNVKRNKDIAWGMIRLCWSSVSQTAIAQMQDFLELDDTARMNIPSTLGGNWEWRLEDFNMLDDKLAEKILLITKMFGRLNDKL